MLTIVKDLFVNPTGLLDAASIYGIFLNKFGATVFAYNYLYSTHYSSSATLENIKVHGLKHSMVILVQQQNSASIYINNLESGEIIDSGLNQLDEQPIWWAVTSTLQSSSGSRDGRCVGGFERV